MRLMGVRSFAAPVGLRVASLGAIVALAAACTGPVPSSTPAPPSNGPSASPSPSPTVAPTPSPTVAVVCGVQDDSGRLPSDRLVDVRVSQAGDNDIVTFVFGDPSSPGPPQGQSTGAIRAVEPPFTASGSGAEIEVPGEHHVEIRFTGMSLYDDEGAATYDGPTSFREAFPALRSVEQFDAFEGQSGWIIGYDGPGCVTLASGAGSVSVVIEHPPG